MEISHLCIGYYRVLLLVYYKYLYCLIAPDQQRAQDQILELLPMVNEVNAVSEELDKHKGFEIVLLSEEAQEGNNRETK